MENLSIHHLAMFMPEEIYMISGENNLWTEAGKKAIPYKENSSSPSPIEEDTSEETVSIEFDGGFEKGVMIIYRGSSLTQDLQELLFKILQAVGCSLKDVALVSSQILEASATDAITSMNPCKIIVFGTVRNDIMSYHKSNYEIENEDGTEYLFADDLKIISENKELKKSLWNELQVLFNITKKHK
ncbi:hypothetical protein [Aquiflexum balticum]|nr:hypothetical protein [Aquiflexum balticum]